MPTIADCVKAAKNPQEAMLAIALALDRIEAKLDSVPAGDAWGAWEPEPVDATLVEIAERDDGTVEAIFNTEVSEEKRGKRAAFAEQYLADFDSTITDAYIDAGPMWLDGWDHKFVTSLPRHAHMEMINDVFEDNKEEGAAMGRDLLKDKSPGNAPGRWDAATLVD